MDDFFHYISRGVIVVPIVIVILSLILKFNQNPKKETINKVLPTFIPSPSLAKKIDFDLSWAWVCHYKTKDQEYLLRVENKKIDLEATVSGQFKKYDLSSYAPIIGSMLNMDINQLESLAKPYLPKGIDLKSLVESCKKQ